MEVEGRSGVPYPALTQAALLSNAFHLEPLLRDTGVETPLLNKQATLPRPAGAPTPVPVGRSLRGPSGAQ